MIDIHLQGFETGNLADSFLWPVSDFNQSYQTPKPQSKEKEKKKRTSKRT